MTKIDWRATAESMDPHTFELLVRAYCKRQAWRVRTGERQVKDVSVSFSIRFDRNGEMEKAEWTMCLDWGPDTKGEVLDGVAEELVRRDEWRMSPKATLRQIEGPPSTEF